MEIENFAYVRFNPEFFEQNHFKEMMDKDHKRPYLHIRVTIDHNTFFIPFRSNLSHSYGFRFDNSEGKSGSGIDFSKALLINDYEKHIDARHPIVTSKQHAILKRDIDFIIKKFQKYIQDYCKAYQSTNEKWKQRICTYSTLQNFHQELGL